MKRLAILLLVFLCTSCTALPKEERAFAVALCVEKPDAWRVHARIPTYQNGGGYRTITGTGDTLEQALAGLESAAPMHLTFSQLRLLVLDEALAENDALAESLTVLADRADMRLQCNVVMTGTPGQQIADALKPSAGARLSKSIDVLLDTHAEQGSFLALTLAELLCMGERQTPVLMRAVLSEKELAFSGGYALTASLQQGVRLDEPEIRLLSLLNEQTGEMQLELKGLYARVREIHVRQAVTASLDAAQVDITLLISASTGDGTLLMQDVADACAALLGRLSAAGCDVLGLGRKAILCMVDMSAWHALDWPECLRHLTWAVSVNAQQPT